MINRICNVCETYVTDSWTLVVSDEKGNKEEISGHLKCVNQIEDKYKNIKNVNKLSIKQILEKLI